MPQTKTLAEHINDRRAALSQICGSQVTSDKALVEQAVAFSKSDNAKLERFGNNFEITNELRKSPHLQANFNHFLVEPLLREGSFLLDRCLQQRREYEDLKTKWFEACVQVDELFRLNEITEKEETENYDLPSQIAQKEHDSILLENTQIKETLKIIRDDYYKNFESATNQLGTYEAEMAKNLDKAHDFRAAANIRAGREKVPIKIQETQQLGLENINKEKLEGAKHNIVMKQSFAKFQRERNDVARLVALRRAEQLINPLGALNFREQMIPIWDRLQNDLAAAWFRLLAAAKGFEQLYQYPMNIFPPNSPKGGFKFDDLVTWCQNANTWLASFLDTQQQVTCSFSLKQLMTRSGFNAGLSSGKWRFKLNEKHFYNKQFVRLRSFAIQIDSGHRTGSWNIAVAPPTKAIIRQNNGTINKLEQGHIGTLFLGRVNERTYAVVPEASAPPKLYNASPIGEEGLSGEWGIGILGHSTLAIPASGIQDIDIHLTVALV